MCTLTKECPELKVADAPIKVYKRVFPETINCCISLTKLFMYQKGQIYESPLDPFEKSSELFRSGRGFYSYQNRIGSNSEFIIPRGASYYLVRDLYSEHMIYHSSQIIFNRMI